MYLNWWHVVDVKPNHDITGVFIQDKQRLSFCTVIPGIISKITKHFHTSRVEAGHTILNLQDDEIASPLTVITSYSMIERNYASKRIHTSIFVLFLTLYLNQLFT